MDPILSEDALRRLTGYARASEQRRVLDEEGIPYKIVRRQIIVLNSHVTAWMEGRPMRRHVEPNLSAVS